MALLKRSPDLACRQVVELVNDYLEGTLARSERRRFERHLRACPNCSEYLRQMRRTIEVTGRLTPEDLTPEAEAGFLDLFRSWQAEGGAGAGGGGGGTEAEGEGS